jgi:hypothetical protein
MGVVTTQVPVREIPLKFDPQHPVTLVLPASCGESVRFASPTGRLTITFLSPLGADVITVTDADVVTLSEIGGIFPFRCTIDGAPQYGGVVDIRPHP